MLASVALNGPYGALQVVNGPSHPGANKLKPARATPDPPQVPTGPPPPGWRQVILDKGPAGWAEAVRSHQGLLITDTTMCVLQRQLLPSMSTVPHKVGA